MTILYPPPCDAPDMTLYKVRQRFAVLTLCMCVCVCVLCSVQGHLTEWNSWLLRWSFLFFEDSEFAAVLLNHRWQPPLPSGHPLEHDARRSVSVLREITPHRSSLEVHFTQVKCSFMSNVFMSFRNERPPFVKLESHPTTSIHSPQSLPPPTSQSKWMTVGYFRITDR